MPSRPRALPDVPPTFAPFPDWARVPRSYEAIGEGADNANFLAGAGLAALHPIAMCGHPLGSLLRQRLALSSAEAVVKLQGRTEDAATLRDHLYLTRAGDEPGPAGRTLLAWRALSAKTGARSVQWLDALPVLLQLSGDEPVRQAIEIAIGLASSEGSTIKAAADAGMRAIQLTNSRSLGLWLADAVLARRLNWPLPVPLLAANLKRDAWRFASGSQADPAPWHTACAGAYVCAAAKAADLYADLARKAERLLEAAPRQRGKGTGEAVMAFMSEDALAARARSGTSDRSSRRLFERLTELGAVRELTGRATFRLYGL